MEPCIFFSLPFIRCACSASKVAVKYDVSLTGAAFLLSASGCVGSGDYSSFGIREDENWRLVFLIFITPRFFLPPGKSVMWLRLDAARHVTGWFETIF
ncbi:hypothetical protein NL293_14480 [Klebsiella pneumoniae]|nr:hypothetical protein [Klebsiella pneumoniae]MCP5584278.1 hypothetical protein [Klebsiella pneumoniae]MCP5719365.1 hypothetical protein [Klebsiella pneumoniae]